MAIKVLVADQERAFADVLSARLDEENDIEVVGVVQLQTPSWSLLAGKFTDVVLLDADLPNDAANRLSEELFGSDKPIRVIMLSFSSEPERIVKALRARAAAWVRKDESLEHLLHVIRGVARGESWLPASETANVIQLLIWGQNQQQLHLFVHTVRTHMQNLMAKLGVPSMLEAVAVTRDDARAIRSLAKDDTVVRVDLRYDGSAGLHA